jgi:hypothetical protein
MMDDDETELEYSPLSGMVIRDGITVSVQIYRLAGESGGWSLEVIDEENASTVWEDLFDTDAEARAEFDRTLEAEGIRSFAERPPGRPH